MIADVYDFYILNVKLRGILYGELITAKIDEASAKEEVRVANLMMKMMSTRLRSVFVSYHGIIYKYAYGCNMIMDMIKLTQPPSLNHTRRTIRRGSNGTVITIRTMSVSVRILIIEISLTLKLLKTDLSSSGIDQTPLLPIMGQRKIKDSILKNISPVRILMDLRRRDVKLEMRMIS